jgi:hypothetical protein
LPSTGPTTGIGICVSKNTSTDEHGDDVRLKKGAEVEVTVTAEPKTSTTINKDS